MSNIVVQAPFRPTRILVFDVETTGLLPRQDRYTTSPIPLSNYPYITQASYVMYDLSRKKIIETYDTYIRLPGHVTIGEETAALTGITNELCREHGQDILEFISCFYDAYVSADVLVAHNFDFDEKMILVELERNRERMLPECLSLFHTSIEKLRNVDRYCTMKQGTALCNILVDSNDPGKPPRKKWPKLSELYVKLFDEPAPDGLHNSLVDVMVTLKCYLKMRHNEDLP
jgi:DNA polymerase-3 subunit alpha